jgi:two-component system repressor protein LuxO
MKNWQMIHEIVGCNATLRMAAMQAVDAVEQGRHFVVEGEPGTGRRLLARSAWCHRSPGVRSLFTLDCSIFPADGAETLLFGGSYSRSTHATAQSGKLNLRGGGGLLLLHAESLPLKTQGRLARLLDQHLGCPSQEATQLLMTCGPALDASPSLHPDLDALLVRVRVPALRERVEDIRALAETFLHYAAPFDRVRCSQALIDRFCSYDWPGNITELHTVLRRLLLENHNGLLDVRHLVDLMHRDESCFALLQPSHRSGLSHLPARFIPLDAPTESRSVQ